MAGRAGLLELSAGSALLLAGTEWTVAAIEAQHGRVLLSAGGEERWRSIRWLVHHPDCQPVPDDAAERARLAGQPPVLDDLTDYQRQVVRLRVAHLLEAETGFRGGDPLHPDSGEPRPAYDPRATTLGQRRRAKAAELKTLGASEAALLGLGQVSERTLERMAAAWKDRGPAGCIDGRWVRAGGGHPSVTEEVREAIFAVRAETRKRSRIGMKARCVLIAQYVAEHFGPDAPVPGYWTLREVWREWFGPGGTRPRYDRAAADIEASKVHVTVHRPGQVIALDTTPLPVKVRDGVFGEPVSAHLTLALDLFTHSAVAFRLTLVSDTSVDIAMLLRDVMMPLPMRDGWGLRWNGLIPGCPPASSRTSPGTGSPGCRSSRRRPSPQTTGVRIRAMPSCRRNRRWAATSSLPGRCARRTRPLSGQLPGYTGVDVADRGADPEADAVLTMEQMGRLVAEWVISVWQNRVLGEHAPAWGPGERHSPNTLFAAAMNQGGFALQIPRPELYYELLPAHYVKIHAERGVKIGGLWYGRSDPALKPYEGKLPGRGGQHKGKWVIRGDRRDRRAVFFQDPADPAKWHVLRWNGLPPEGEIPAFSDKTAEELLREARAGGLSPQSDADLLPVLLKVLGGLVPSGKWPSQLGKKEKKGRARETAQGDQAASDRHGSVPAAARRAEGSEGKVVPLRWPEQASQGRRRPRRRAPPQATRTSSISSGS